MFKEVHDLESARYAEGVMDMGFNLASGTLVTTMNHGANRPGFVVTQGSSRAEAMSNAERAYRTLRFEMT